MAQVVPTGHKFSVCEHPRTLGMRTRCGKVATWKLEPFRDDSTARHYRAGLATNFACDDHKDDLTKTPEYMNTNATNNMDIKLGDIFIFKASRVIGKVISYKTEFKSIVLEINGYQTPEITVDLLLQLASKKE